MPRDVRVRTACAATLLLLAAPLQAADPQPLPDAASPFAPGFADLMALLVAPRHAKLQYAAAQRNWELALFEVQQLRASLQRTAGVIPLYLGRNVAQTIATLMETQLQATESAIVAADTKQFARAYGELTVACNACHTYLEHPFIIVKVPQASAASAFPGQDFKPQR